MRKQEEVQKAVRLDFQEVCPGKSVGGGKNMSPPKLSNHKWFDANLVCDRKMTSRSWDLWIPKLTFRMASLKRQYVEVSLQAEV